MIRHIFIGNFKDDVSEETKHSVLADMRAMKDNIPGIAAQQVGFSTEWAGQKNQIVMTVDFLEKADFDVYMKHPYHMDHVDRLGTKYFDRSTFVSAQFEFTRWQ